MGCRLKDAIFLACLLLLATGVWFSYSRPVRDLHDPWPWADESVETSRDLLHNPDYDGYFSEDTNYEDDGNRGFDEDDNVEFTNSFVVPSNMQIGFKENLSEDRGTSAQHQNDEEYDVPYNEKLIDLRISQGDENVPTSEPLLNKAPPVHINSAVVEEHFLKESETLLGSETLQNPPGGKHEEEQQQGTLNDLNLGEPTYDAASAILVNHAERAKQLGILPVEMPREDNAPAVNQEPRFEVAGKYKPRIVLRSLDARQVREASKDVPKIPRIIHQSWETRDVPVSFVPWIQSWLKKNPNWEYWFWTKDDVSELIQKNYPTFSNLLREDSISIEDRSNIMRYFIIHAHGGLYAELDMECLNSMDSWVFSHGCFLAEETREHSYLVNNKLQGNVINALLACKAHHPFYEVIIHALPDYLMRYKGDPVHASGSFFLNDIYQAFKKHPLPASLSEYGDVALIEPDYFIPRYDERHWRAIDEACNRNIVDMPFHVSWLCTLWIRKRMHENQPYKHSYTDHHWMDLGTENINTVSVISVIQDVLASREQPAVGSQTEIQGSQLPNSNVQGVAYQEQQPFPVIPQAIPQTQEAPRHNQLSDQQQALPIMPQELPILQQQPSHPELAGIQQPPQVPQQPPVMPQMSQQQIIPQQPGIIPQSPLPQQDQPQFPITPQEPQQQMPQLQQPVQQQQQQLVMSLQIPQGQDDQYRLPDISKPQEQSQNLDTYNKVPVEVLANNEMANQQPVQTFADQRPAVYSDASQTNSGFVNLQTPNQPQRSDISAPKGSPLDSGTIAGSLPNSVGSVQSGYQSYNNLNDYSKDTPTGNLLSSVQSGISSQYQSADISQDVINSSADKTNQVRLYEVLKQGASAAGLPSSAQTGSEQSVSRSSSEPVNRIYQ